MIETFLIDKRDLLESCAKHRFSVDGMISVLATEREDTIVFYSSIAGALFTELLTDVDARSIVLSKAKCNPIIPSSPSMLEIINMFNSSELQITFEYQNNTQTKIKIEDERNSIVITI